MFFTTGRSVSFLQIWNKVFKNGPSKICGRQPSKILKGYGLLSFSFTWSILEYFVPYVLKCFGFSGKPSKNKKHRVYSYVFLWHFWNKFLIANWDALIPFLFSFILLKIKKSWGNVKIRKSGVEFISDDSSNWPLLIILIISSRCL